MSRAKVNYKNPDFKEETDEFSDIVDDFIKQRKTLKKNLKEQRGEIVTERVGLFTTISISSHAYIKKI